MKMRLDRWLATLSLGSRSEVKEWIRGGKAAVNGRIIRDPALSFETEEDRLALNGKDIVDGKEEEIDNLCAFKMKRTYHVNGDGSIQTHTALDMKPEEIREFFVKTFKQLGLGMGDEAKEDIEDLVRNFNMEYTEDATYTFLPDGWVRTIDCIVTTKEPEHGTLSMTYRVYVK